MQHRCFANPDAQLLLEIAAKKDLPATATLEIKETEGGPKVEVTVTVKFFLDYCLDCERSAAEIQEELKQAS